MSNKDERDSWLMLELFIKRRPLNKEEILRQLEDIRSESLNRYSDMRDPGDIWADDILALTQAINFIKERFSDEPRARAKSIEKNKYLF